MFWRRSSTEDFGVSTTTWVVAVAIFRSLECKPGGTRLMLDTLHTATTSASTALAASHGFSCHIVHMRFPSFIVGSTPREQRLLRERCRREVAIVEPEPRRDADPGPRPGRRRRRRRTTASSPAMYRNM